MPITIININIVIATAAITIHAIAGVLVVVAIIVAGFIIVVRLVVISEIAVSLVVIDTVATAPVSRPVAFHRESRLVLLPLVVQSIGATAPIGR